MNATDPQFQAHQFAALVRDPLGGAGLPNTPDELQSLLDQTPTIHLDAQPGSFSVSLDRLREALAGVGLDALPTKIFLQPEDQADD
jgi:hypothetical protein